MDPVYLFDLASRHANWASVRQSVVTTNIANANTAGYIAEDIEPFADVLDQTNLVMASTSPGHLGVDGGDLQAGATGKVGGWEVKEAGGPVSLDQELVKADEVNRAYSLDTTVVKAFNRMLLASVRSGG